MTSMASWTAGMGRCMGGVLVAGLLLGSGMASAAQVLTTGDDQQIATAILNLDVGENQFNVNFEYGTAPVIYSGGFDVDNVDDAILVRDAIVQALNDHNVAPSNDAIRAGTLLNNDVDFHIAWSHFSETQTTSERGQYNGADWVGLGSSILQNSSSVVYTTVTAVPEPGTALLMGLGLVGLGVGGRRRA
jgi:hypothetical protein